MNSVHLKNLYESLRKTTVSIIKEKVSFKVINIKTRIKVDIDDFNFIEIKEITSNHIKLKDDSLMYLENIKNIEVLIDILKYVEKWFENKRKDSVEIQWNILDFEQCALEIEETNADFVKIYDRSKFRKALTILEKHYDCNNGISWLDIQNHLNIYCKI